VELTGVCDTDSQIGLSIAKQFEVPYFQTIQDLLENVDAVSIATPTSNHHEHVILCLENGVHVLVEKPIAETLEQAQHLVNISQGSGLVFQVGQIERFNPAFFELVNLMESMSPLAINFYRLSPSHGSNLDVDVILDLMIHDLNLLLALVKKPLQKLLRWVWLSSTA
jgi:predicted dehydrogenase